MNEEDIKKKREENLKIEEEADRFFFIRLGRLALIVNCVTPFLILPGLAAWRVLEQPSPRQYFLSNLGWLLLADLYSIGTLGIICAAIYLLGGSKGWRLCGLDGLQDLLFGKGDAGGGCAFWFTIFLLIFPYIVIVGVGIAFKEWIK